MNEYRTRLETSLLHFQFQPDLTTLELRYYYLLSSKVGPEYRVATTRRAAFSKTDVQLLWRKR